MAGCRINLVERRTFLDLEVCEDSNDNRHKGSRNRARSDFEVEYYHNGALVDEELCSTSAGDTTDTESLSNWPSNNEDIQEMPSSSNSSGWVPVLLTPVPVVMAWCCPVQLPVQTVSLTDEPVNTPPTSRKLVRPPGNFATDMKEQLTTVRPDGLALGPPGEFATGAKDQRTTVIIRNVPADCTRETFIRALNSAGFLGAYDFAYVPRNFRESVNLGYALVNILDHCLAKALIEKGLLFGMQHCEAGFSEAAQGCSALIEHYRNSAVMHEVVPSEFRPAVFRQGSMVPFPPPTKKIRHPRIRHAKHCIQA